MSGTTLTHTSPLAQRLAAWFSERFPLANGILFVILYLTCALLARHSYGAIAVSLVDLIGALVCWSYFLLLRIFDEHKDYQLDLHNHPQRILQSGLITLLHLRVLAVIAIASQISWSLYVDDWQVGAATLAWIIAFVWTALMGKEFFCGAWLEKRLTLYAFSHMLVMPLIVWWLLNLGASGVSLNANVLLLMLVAFVSGFCFEITRKTRGSEEERPTVDSYSRIYGHQGAANIILALILLLSGLQIALLYQLSEAMPWIAIVVIALMTALVAQGLLGYKQAPTAAARESNEKRVALLMLSGYLCITGVALSGVAVQLFWW